jgi:hypothetical protein
MTTSMARGNPLVTASMQKNIFEHISLMALEQVEIEFQDQIKQLQMMTQNPAAMQNPEMQQQVMNINMQIEARKAILIAEMFEDFAKEEKMLLGDFSNEQGRKASTKRRISRITCSHVFNKARNG